MRRPRFTAGFLIGCAVGAGGTALWLAHEVNAHLDAAATVRAANRDLDSENRVLWKENGHLSESLAQCRQHVPLMVRKVVP